MIGKRIDMRNCHEAGFTLIEIIVTIVIIGLVTGFALVNFNKTIERSHYQEARNQLKMIHAAAQLYFAKHGFTIPEYSGSGALDEINSGLHLGINANGFEYTCSRVSDTEYECDAVRNNSQGQEMYRLVLTQDTLSSTNPSCQAPSGYSCP
jgi:prepilin-type N-terminal cleavage/methylation domain-containing protein